MITSSELSKTFQLGVKINKEEIPYNFNWDPVSKIAKNTV